MKSLRASPPPTKAHWKKVSRQRRAGVLAPLFCIYSKQSCGIGEIPDLELLAKWCEKTGVSIIQILPLNDTGWDFRPYDSQSAYALDPMYLRIPKIKHSAVRFFKPQLEVLQKNLAHCGRFVHYRVKSLKMKMLWDIFQHPKTDKNNFDFLHFVETEKSWIEAYAAFKVLKELNQNRPWWEWPEHLRLYDPRIVEKELASVQDSVLFHKWLAWQTTIQMQETSLKIRAKNILVMADMPFLVSRDSADVWSNSRFFKLHLESGAPPDLYIAEGQRWGMPPYNWEQIEAEGFHFLKDRIRFLGRYAHLYRIDHFVGLFRIWTIPVSEPRETLGKNGVFDPAEEELWRWHGEKIVKAMLEASDMLPCAEDLGVVPDCAYEVLQEYQIPGSDIQRWVRDWKGDEHFLEPGEYREFSMSSLSTHDMTTFQIWWDTEVSAEEKKALAEWAKTSLPSESTFTAFYEKVLETVLATRSIFSIHALQDWLILTGHPEFKCADHRINEPGTVHDGNWSIRIPFSIEEMLVLSINAKIRRMIKKTDRRVQ